MNYSGVTDSLGQVFFTLPQGDYRFRGDSGGTQYWSSETDACTLPGCTTAVISVSKELTVTVSNTAGVLMPGLSVYAFDGDTYTNYTEITDENGAVVFSLPDGDYRFRADYNGTQFWSAEANHCSLPGCETAAVTVTAPVTVSVADTDGTAQAGLSVYAFDGETYTNFSAETDENGQVAFTLPQGDYRFRVDLNGTQFWSGEENHCTLPGCESANVTVSKPVTVTVAGEEANPYPGLSVYVFDGDTYSGYSGTTDESGQVVFTLPVGAYRFRADYDGVPFWSGMENTCTLPACEADAVTLPGGTGQSQVTIEYMYDALNRLTSATYSNGTAFTYTYRCNGKSIRERKTDKQQNESIQSKRSFGYLERNMRM
jgi:YD repeat-containing protein